MAKYFDIFAEKCEWLLQCKRYSHFWSKNINVSENILATTVNKFVINKLVKLMMLWAAGLLMHGKSCRPRSEAGFCSIWSSTTLFAQACQSQVLG